jgi:hypothetical protein
MPVERPKELPAPEEEEEAAGLSLLSWKMGSRGTGSRQVHVPPSRKVQCCRCTSSDQVAGVELGMSRERRLAVIRAPVKPSRGCMKSK